MVFGLRQFTEGDSKSKSWDSFGAFVFSQYNVKYDQAGLTKEASFSKVKESNPSAAGKSLRQRFNHRLWSYNFQQVPQPHLANSGCMAVLFMPFILALTVHLWTKCEAKSLPTQTQHKALERVEDVSVLISEGLTHFYKQNRWCCTRRARQHMLKQHLAFSVGTDWLSSDQPRACNAFWCQRSILLNLLFNRVPQSAIQVIHPSSHLRWLRSGWSRSSECTAGNERAVSCRRDGHQVSNGQ